MCGDDGFSRGGVKYMELHILRPLVAVGFERIYAKQQTAYIPRQCFMGNQYQIFTIFIKSKIKQLLPQEIMNRGPNRCQSPVAVCIGSFAPPVLIDTNPEFFHRTNMGCTAAGHHVYTQSSESFTPPAN